MAGATTASVARDLTPNPTILVFDSGLGGLTVLDQVRRARPDASYVYVADDAGFPYGRLSEATLVDRSLAVMERLVSLHRPDLIVIACNTASTIVLPALRQRFPMPIVGVVPPIKPASEATRSRMITLLATPGTVARAYTHDLIETYAGQCAVTLVGAPNLARFAESQLAGAPVDDATLSAEIAACFVTGDDGRRTDVVALACTHYPLLLGRFQALAPWPVTWIDPAPAIARRVTQLLGAADRSVPYAGTVLGTFTSGSGLTGALRASLDRHGIGSIAVEAMPLGLQ